MRGYLSTMRTCLNTYLGRYLKIAPKTRVDWASLGVNNDHILNYPKLTRRIGVFTRADNPLKHER
jgi:hypothetical protein